MKNLKKLVAIGVSLMLATSLFTGCSYDAKGLADAFSKTQKITSAEVKMEIGLRFAAENLSAEEQEAVSTVIPMVNSSKMMMNAKMNQNVEGTVGKMQADLAIQAGPMPLNMGFWVDANMADGKGGFKEIVKMPEMAQAQLGGKQYIVLDSSKMGGATGMNMDFSKLTKSSQDMQKKLGEIVAKNMASLNPDVTYVTNKGITYMKLPDGGRNVHIYELRLDDKGFKDLIKGSANNLVGDKEVHNFLKDYLTTVMQVSVLKEEEVKAAQVEMDKAFEDFEKGLPEFIVQMNKVLNSFDGVPLIGEKGIVIDYAVDNDGYIVNEKGNIDLVLDAPKLMTVAQNLSGTSMPTEASKITGIYKLGVDFNTNTFNINKNVEVAFPEITSENSIQYEDLLKGGQ